MKLSLFFHCILAAYLWLIDFVSLGYWNIQQNDFLLVDIIHGKGIEIGDVGFLVFVALPALLFWIGYRNKNKWWCIAALVTDTIWLIMQILSWWVPYISGAKKSWQLDYAKGLNTKLLPSFGNHIAPDAMHFVIHILLVFSLVTGIWGLSVKHNIANERH